MEPESGVIERYVSRLQITNWSVSFPRDAPCCWCRMLIVRPATTTTSNKARSLFSLIKRHQFPALCAVKNMSLYTGGIVYSVLYH